MPQGWAGEVGVLRGGLAGGVPAMLGGVKGWAGKGLATREGRQGWGVKGWACKGRRQEWAGKVGV